VAECLPGSTVRQRQRHKFNDARDHGLRAVVAGVVAFWSGQGGDSGGRAFFGRPTFAQKRATCSCNTHVAYFINQSKPPFRFKELHNAKSLVENMCRQAVNK
jgi:hypothetical protein